MEGSATIVFVLRSDNKAEKTFSEIIGHIDSKEDLGFYQLKTDSKNDSKRRLNGSLSGVLRVDDITKIEQLYGTEWPVVRLKILADNLAGEAGNQIFTAALELVREIYDLTDPEYVFGHSHTDLDYFGVDTVDWGLSHPIDEDALAAHRVAQPMWLMLLPPAMVETYGRDWLHGLPADRVEDLADGAVLIVGVEDFTDCDSEIEFSQRIEEAQATLEEAFDDAPV